MRQKRAGQRYIPLIHFRVIHCPGWLERVHTSCRWYRNRLLRQELFAAGGSTVTPSSLNHNNPGSATIPTRLGFQQAPRIRILKQFGHRGHLVPALFIDTYPLRKAIADHKCNLHSHTHGRELADRHRRFLHR